MSTTTHADDSSHKHTPHVLPLRIYFGVWVALLVLTAITLAVSYYDFGEGNLIIALVVATIKATLVSLFFMHLFYDHKLNALVFGGSIVFLFLFFFFTLADTTTRGQVDPANGVFVNKHLQQKPSDEGHAH